MPVAIEMGWRHLLFENWPVEPAVVDAHLPDSLDVDRHDGQAWLSVIPFVNVDLRPKGLPRRLGIDLPEINVRTYVTCEGEPGVYFFSLDAAGITSVVGARFTHRLPYYYARAYLRSAGRAVRFESRRRHPGARSAAYAATYRATGDSFDAADEPLASFLTERYRLYTEGTDGHVRHTDVDHEPWRLHPASADVERNTMLAAEGFEEPDSKPIRYYSPGMDVVAEPSERWTDSG